MLLENIESRFKEVAGIEGDLTVFPLPKGASLQTTTDKKKSDTFGEVFTPLWLVDEMILQMDSDPVAAGEKLFKANAPLDLCAGYGQFTIRMLRCISNALGNDFNIKGWLNKHSFSELQCESVYKLLYIFGNNTNIYIGDAQCLNTLDEDDKGILIHDGKSWVNVTKDVKKNKFGQTKTYGTLGEAEFCTWLALKNIKKESSKPTLFDSIALAEGLKK
jgi:hypothetical protein